MLYSFNFSNETLYLQNIHVDIYAIARDICDNGASVFGKRFSTRLKNKTENNSTSEGAFYKVNKLKLTHVELYYFFFLLYECCC